MIKNLRKVHLVYVRETNLFEQRLSRYEVDEIVVGRLLK